MLARAQLYLQKFLPYPGYQVPFADKIQKEANIPTGAVGLITTGIQAEEILQNERADMIFIARELFAIHIGHGQLLNELGYELEAPEQYERGW